MTKTIVVDNSLVQLNIDSDDDEEPFGGEKDQSAQPVRPPRPSPFGDVAGDLDRIEEVALLVNV